MIVNINNSQYKVAEGDVILVDKIEGEPKSKLSFNKVLLSVNKETVKVGKPVVEKMKVDAEIVEQVKGEKIVSSTYKAKSRQRRKVGNRAKLTKIKINKIN